MKMNWLMLVLFIFGCATTKDRIINVSRGMADSEVRDIMGTPVDRTFRGEQELWSYPAAKEGQFKVIVFQNRKVVDLLNAVEGDANHLLGKSDVNTAGKRNYVCTGKNEFGRFAEGGGCSLYGCWAPGGSCNGFGCTSAGFCSSRGCPNKVESFKCDD